jgi:methylated-DNA-[protein]-cysteine S-methyltransferase
MNSSTAYYHSPIGTLIVTGSEEGISSIDFHDGETAAGTGSIPSSLQDCIQQFDEYFSGARKEFTLRLAIEGSEFERRVWNELLKIPFGRTASYIQIARQLGDEKSVRAVGTANGRNRLAIVIPCHRVIGSSGELTGYAGGLWRKRWLLEHEGSIPQISLPL